MAKRNVNDSTKAQSKKDGTVVTDEGKKVEATGPAIPDGAADVNEESPEHKARILNWDEQKELIGELEPGDEGYLPTDRDGNITGPAKKGPIPEGTFGVPVTAAFDQRPDLLQTPSGAPITARMNPTRPSPDLSGT